MLKKIFIAALVVFAINGIYKAYSQNQGLTCSSLPTDIKSYYQRSLYGQIVYEGDSLLKVCKYNKEDLEQIYIYMIAACREVEEDSLFLFYSKKLLELNPHYEYQGSEPEVLRNIRGNFKIYPRYTVGMSVGFDKVLVDRINVYQVFDSADATAPYSSFPALTASFMFQYNLSYRLSVAYDVGVYFSNFTKNIYIYNGFLTTTYKESVQGIGNKLMVKVNFPFRLRNGNEYVPYILGGGFFDYKIRATGRVSIDKDTTNPLNSQLDNFELPVRSNTIYYTVGSNHPMRIPFNFGYLYGAGFNFISRNMTFFTEILFQRGFVQHNNPEARFIPPLVRNYYYIDDDIILNKLYFRFGFTLNFKYKVQKR